MDIDWAEFERKFPTAFAWAVRNSLERHKAALETEIAHPCDPRRATWIKSRLAELNTRFKENP